MNFLFIYTKNSICNLISALKDAGHNVSTLESIYFDPNVSVPAENMVFSEHLQQNHYDFVISYLFIPAISTLCFEHTTRYISWTYDSPLAALFTPSILYPTNYLFIFDYYEYLRLKKLQLPHLYYLPLAADITHNNLINISADDEAQYTHDISFIGGLYENNNYDFLFPHFPKKIQSELKQLLTTNLYDWSNIRPWKTVSSQCTACISSLLCNDHWNTSPLLSDESFAYLSLIPQKQTQIERIMVLNTLGEFFSPDLYTNNASPFLHHVVCHPPVNYHTDARRIFTLSKINLNITLSSIESGIPQRIFDILASGGFVLTNYQKELDNFFVIGKDIEVFHNLNELVAKTYYYLSHEKERRNIAVNGYKTVASQHTLSTRIAKMLSILPTQTED